MFKDYLKSRINVIILMIVVEGVFASSYFLFDMPAVTVLYPLILSTSALIVAGVIDFVFTFNKHRKLTQNEISASSDPIEKDYQEIIRKLKEEEAYSRQKTTSDYNNMVEYYTVWAHQIKTPIASMRLQIQSEDTESARKLMGDLNRIEAYVEMVLTFLRLDSDSTDYLIKEYDLDEIIRPAIRKFSREFILKKLKLEYEPIEFKTITDSKWLSFIIEQVISNAVKYTSEGYVRIYMSEPGILCIEDTGVGISEEDLPRIFENGYTGFNGREDKRASGIGLYLCKRISDNLGHKIYAESKVGEGTKIFLDMRAKKLDVE
ncbi:MAG: HAMP domain-containing histidine kinase [Ruminococcaceae bacterium]|jgi:signal transduction histidine kinase|nr:HAMP domain-containing histidine kinase [Oscillospiraceae bacterium]